MRRRYDPDSPEAFYRYERFNDYSTIRRIREKASLRERIDWCHGMLSQDERASLVPPSDGSGHNTHGR